MNSFFRYLALAFLPVALISSACSRTSKSDLERNELQRRLFADTIACLEPDTSCVVTIDVSSVLDTSFYFADIVRDLHFIPLETTNESRLGSVRRLAFTSENIIVSDPQSVKVFTLDGKYVGSIPLGTSDSKNDFTIDQRANEIIVYAQGSIGHYSMDCQRKWVERLLLNFTGMTTTRSGDNLAIFFALDDKNPILDDLAGSTFLVMNRKGNIVAKPHVPVVDIVPPREGVALPFSDLGVVLSYCGCDTIFTITDSSFTARYALEYGDRQYGPPHGDPDMLFFAGNAQLTKGGLFFKIQGMRARTVFAFYDRRTGNLRGGFPEFDYRLIPPVYNPIATCGDYYAAIFNTYLTDDDNGRFTFAGNIVPDSSKAILRSIRHGDNPIVALYRVEID